MIHVRKMSANTASATSSPPNMIRIGRRSRDALIATVTAIPGAKNSTLISNPP